MNRLTNKKSLKIIVEKQILLLLNNNVEVKKYSISTALLGLGCKKNSFKTPIGMHKVNDKIGEGKEFGTIFKSRKTDGAIWQGEFLDKDLILSRIITLDGLENDINKGGNVDSLSRYIYIHGTNHEYKIGSPVSAGCIRMKNKDIIELFELIEKGTEVYIV